MFAYPPQTKPEEKEKVEKVATAVLSTTAKAKAREKKKEKEGGPGPMDLVRCLFLICFFHFSCGVKGVSKGSLKVNLRC